MASSADGCVKINVDVAIEEATGFVGIGVVVRDNCGMVLGAVLRRLAGNFSPHVGECLAVRALGWPLLGVIRIG